MISNFEMKEAGIIPASFMLFFLRGFPGCGNMAG